MSLGELAEARSPLVCKSEFNRGSPSLLLRRFLLQFRIQVNRAAGYVEGLAPGCEPLFLDGNLMTSRGDCDRGRRIADKRTVNFDVRPCGRGIDGERGLSGRSRGLRLIGRGCGI